MAPCLALPSLCFIKDLFRASRIRMCHCNPESLQGKTGKAKSFVSEILVRLLLKPMAGQQWIRKRQPLKSFRCSISRSRKGAKRQNQIMSPPRLSKSAHDSWTVKWRVSVFPRALSKSTKFVRNLVRPRRRQAQPVIHFVVCCDVDVLEVWVVHSSSKSLQTLQRIFQRFHTWCVGSWPVAFPKTIRVWFMS